MVVYVDTSVIGGCFDEEFEEWSVLLFQEFLYGKKVMMLSDLTLQELELAKFKVREKVKEIPQNQISNIFVNDEVIHLAEKYIEEGALTIKSYNDTLHIALATLNNADVLSSWNFKHIVNLDRIKFYNSINLRLGYKIIEIRSPREILKIVKDGNN